MDEMPDNLTIGRLADVTGLSTKTIRFYEEGGYIPRAERTDAGYRIYTQADVRRLKLVKLCRLLGLSLADIRPLLEKAFAVDCSEFASDLAGLIDTQQLEIANEVFSPTGREVGWAREILAKIQSASAGGDGAFGQDGVLIDLAVLKRAQAILDRQAAIDGASAKKSGGARDVA